MNSFIKRTLTGIIYVLFIIISLFSGPLTYYILFTGFLIIGIIEFYKLYDNNITGTWKIINILLSVILFTACFFDASMIFYLPVPAILMVIIIILLTLKLFINGPDFIQDSGKQFFIYLWITLPISLSNYLVFDILKIYTYNYKILLNIFILLWCSDTGAYISGMALGKHLLFKSVSPKKTWEGLIGGVIITLTGAYLISKYNTQFTLNQWLIVGSLVAVFGTLGDLVESLLKRNAKVKDSGTIFPGHGGLLDRIDSLLLTIPAIYIYLKLIQLI